MSVATMATLTGCAYGQRLEKADTGVPSDVTDQEKRDANLGNSVEAGVRVPVPCRCGQGD